MVGNAAVAVATDTATNALTQSRARSMASFRLHRCCPLAPLPVAVANAPARPGVEANGPGRPRAFGCARTSDAVTSVRSTRLPGAPAGNATNSRTEDPP